VRERAAIDDQLAHMQRVQHRSICMRMRTKVLASQPAVMKRTLKRPRKRAEDNQVVLSKLQLC
jgi:hypothetical protein